MKCNKSSITLYLVLLSILFFSSSGLAEGYLTENNVEFEAPDTPTGTENGPFTVVKPGTFNQWITIEEGQGKQTLGGQFRLSFVPNFNFGSVILKAQDQTHSLETGVTYRDIGTENSYLPPFLQILNIRGTEEGYKVNVSADKFSGVDANGKIHTLENTRIQLKDFSVRNNKLDYTGDGDVDATSILKVPSDTFVIDGASKPILTTVNGAETEASISSLVFEKQYSQKKNYTNEDLKQSRSVELYVPAKDIPNANIDYSTTITWTLENAL